MDLSGRENLSVWMCHVHNRFRVEDKKDEFEC